MFCKHCGNKIDNNSSFCSNCGKKVIVAPETIETTNVDSESTIIEKTKKARFSENAKNIINKILFWTLILGISGVALFSGIILVGLMAYGKVYLFDGYAFTKVLSIISIALMVIGVSGIIVKTLFILIFKVGTFPSAIIKRILLIALAVACLGFSVWGFVDCSNTSSNDNSNYNSSGSYGGYNNYGDTVSKSLGLSLSVTSIKISGNYTYVYCSIKNVSHLYGNATMYRYVKVKAVFKDNRGTILDTDWTYAVDSVWLNSGETKTFYYMVQNTSVKSATLSIIE